MAKYSKLDQGPSESDEDKSDEETLFLQTNGNGAKKRQKNGFFKVNIDENHDKEHIGLRPLKGNKKEIADLELRKPVTIRERRCLCFRRIFFVLALLGALGLTAAILYLIPHEADCSNTTTTVTTTPPVGNPVGQIDTDIKETSSNEPHHTAATATSYSTTRTPDITSTSQNVNQGTKHKPWITTFDDTGLDVTSSKKRPGTESCIRLLDVDGDGVLDIILGLAAGKDIIHDLRPERIKEICHKLGLEPPCLGSVVALRGYDGEVLWRFYTMAEIFEINCNIDIDKDGKPDCIGAGRVASTVAFNPYNGSVYWTIDQEIANHEWNFYNVIILPDFTGDGVSEIVLPHGGEPRIAADDPKRHSGRLILIDGATGRHIGRYLEMPESKETYMSPVLHHRKDGSQYILFGSGGETVSGSLLAISIPDFYKYVHNMTETPEVPHVTGRYLQWDKVKILDPIIGIMEIYRSKTKGIMVPPVLIDMNNDGVKDILMSAFDGTFILYDGENLNIIWKIEFDNEESYSTPAPGYFNDDNVTDFMIHSSPGEWPYYNSSRTLVLDGRNGDVLWETSTIKYEMSSDLVARTTEDYRDVFVFRVQGRDSYQTGSGGVVHDVHPQRIINKRELLDEPAAEGHNTSDIGSNVVSQDMTETQEDTGLLQPGMLNIEEGHHDIDTADDDDDDDEVPGDGTDEGEIDYDAVEFKECDQDPKQWYTEIFAVDRTTLYKPVKLFDMKPIKYHYNLTDETRQRLINETLAEGGGYDPMLSKEKFKLGPFCAYMRPEERSTGAIGDVDGDGKLDLIFISEYNAMLRSFLGNYVGMKYRVNVHKVNLEDLILDPNYVSLNVTVSDKMKVDDGEKSITKVKFRPYSEQPWTAYLGTYMNSIYYVDEKH